MEPLTFWILAALIPLWVPALAVLGGMFTLLVVLILSGVVRVAKGGW